MKKILNYINGNLQEPLSGKFMENEDPSRGKVYAHIPESNAEDVELAVEAASRAFPEWSALTARQRSDIMLKVSQLIDDRLEHLAQAESLDNGKPLKLARSVDIPRARDNFAFFATAILHDEAPFFDMGSRGFNYTLRQPIGVVGCISPWNLPLYLFTWKIAPALAAGNCVVAKPSEITPMTAFLLSEICIEAGMPPGVLNILHGTGPSVGQAIVEHPHIKAISFTGGTKTGEHLARTAAPMFKKLSLELGGKNPNLVFADCDFDHAVKTSVMASFANQGQICLCGSRIFVERSIYDKFKEAFIERKKGLKVGPPSEESSRMGAVVSRAHMDKVLGYIKLAKEEGGRVLHGGEQVQLSGEFAGGYYIQPTVIEGLAYNCRTNQEEIFGPVVTLTPFDTEEEALMMANFTQYGLACTLFTQNLDRAHRVAANIQAGIVWINCWLVRDLRTLFGGMKNSGVGREGGYEALHFFTEPKNVCFSF
ncbi:MAG: aldehyde dehydrogenase [Owenweeksia sp.]|nr:aldehyde dehydrogenase [Owenweeksia sp.]